jgi:hypothetical protein
MTSQTQMSTEAVGKRVDDAASGPVGTGGSVRSKINEKINEKKTNEQVNAEADAVSEDVSVMLRDRLQNVLLWLRTAKENLPDLNNSQISADRIAAASGLVDRLHRLALEAAAHGTARGRRQSRAA